MLLRCGERGSGTVQSTIAFRIYSLKSKELRLTPFKGVGGRVPKRLAGNRQVGGSNHTTADKNCFQIF